MAVYKTEKTLVAQYIAQHQVKASVTAVDSFRWPLIVHFLQATIVTQLKAYAVAGAVAQARYITEVNGVRLVGKVGFACGGGGAEVTSRTLRAFVIKDTCGPRSMKRPLADRCSSTGTST